MKELNLKDKELERNLKEVFFGKKDVLTDDQVKKELELGDRIVALLKDDIEEVGINYINKQQEIYNDKKIKENFEKMIKRIKERRQYPIIGKYPARNINNIFGNKNIVIFNESTIFNDAIVFDEFNKNLLTFLLNTFNYNGHFKDDKDGKNWIININFNSE